MEDKGIEDYSNISVTEIAYQKIKELIYTNKFALGEKLNKRILSERINLSSTPITLALKRLWGEGFIDYRSRIGFFVKKFSDLELIEYFELRASLESVAIRLAIENNKSEQLQNIIQCWKEYNGVSEKEYIAADNKLHEEIILCSNSVLIISAWQKLVSNIWQRLGYNRKSKQKGSQNSMGDFKKKHEAIIDAVQRSDAIKAQLLMSNHFLDSARHVRQRMMQNQNIETDK